MSVSFRSIGIWLCVAVAGALALAAIAPGLLAPGSPFEYDPAASMQPPSAAHPCGTDQSGRDICTRLVHGARSSLLIGVVATLIGMTLGLAIGMVAGLFGKAADWAGTRAVEVLYAFPGILLALLIISLTGPGIVPTTIAVGVSTAPGYSRMIRSQLLRVREAAYVEADIVMGRSWWQRVTRTVLPNALRPLLAVATLGIGQAVVWASALSYLGLGDPPPSAEWGAMLNAGATYLQTGQWWLSVMPGAMIALVALIGTTLGRLLDGQMRQAR